MYAMMPTVGLNMKSQSTPATTGAIAYGAMQERLVARRAR